MVMGCVFCRGELSNALMSCLGILLTLGQHKTGVAVNAAERGL